MDNVRNEILLICTADLTRGHTYASTVARLDRLAALLDRPLPPEAHPHTRNRHAARSSSPRAPASRTSSPPSQRTKDYIASGDVFQCVLSQRFDCTPGVPAFDIYRALRVVNPSPYMFFLRFSLDATARPHRRRLPGAPRPLPKPPGRVPPHRRHPQALRRRGRRPRPRSRPPRRRERKSPSTSCSSISAATT